MQLHTVEENKDDESIDSRRMKFLAGRRIDEKFIGLIRKYRAKHLSS